MARRSWAYAALPGGMAPPRRLGRTLGRPSAETLGACWPFEGPSGAVGCASRLGEFLHFMYFGKTLCRPFGQVQHVRDGTISPCLRHSLETCKVEET